ncbi:MAG TPA: anhydro-N-acetylmuramic acid kinase [Bacteroidota bacterium]|nr:anhydro-N-acetylmuramic acid kinase [Bacteroidota bacterium]
MTILQRLQKKKTKLVVGLMSGTSVDGVDAALVKISGSGTSTRLKLLAFDSRPFPKDLRGFVLKNSLPGSGSVDVITRLNILFAHFYAEAVRRVAHKARVPLSNIDLIGSHGQTVHHLPTPSRLFGKEIRATLQIGDPSTLAKLTGIITVGDFRNADMAVGGQGAPLVPYFDYLMFRSRTKNRILLNLGGIANFTILPKNCQVKDIIAFDTGPANMVIDTLMMKFYRKPFDKNGSVAMKGRVLQGLMAWMMSHPYFDQHPPKSTGREVFGKPFAEEILKRTRGVRKQDIIATVTEFTALTIFDQYNRFVGSRMVPDEILVSGGGAHNKAIIEGLDHYFDRAKVKPIEDIGFSSDAKEAICFAVLANETMSEHPANVPSVTGAKRPVVLGKICL